jgi:hypothetical protein
MNALEYTLTIISNVYVVLMWAIFAIFHLALLVLFLLAAWMFSLSPEALLATAMKVYHATHLESILGFLGLVGVSLATLLYFYIRLWRWGFAKLTKPILFRGNREEDEPR